MEKTVVVLAANPLSSVSCGETVAFDLSLGKAKGVANTRTISKSLWTCCVEAVTEYCRIVFDLFPDQYQVCVHGGVARGGVFLTTPTENRSLGHCVGSHSVCSVRRSCSKYV